MELPSISGEGIPGAKSRFDDFVGVHINQTPFIHATVSHPYTPNLSK
jgi:tyrosinase